MPFTVAHIAAALPVRRLPIVLSAFVVGTMAPDFEYFVRLAPLSRWSHHWPGVFIFTLPCALLVLWLYHRYIKNATVALLPQALQGRLPAVEDFRFRGRLGPITISLLLGIASHIVWDWFTHYDTPLYNHWTFLQHDVGVPFVGRVYTFKFLQHVSTIAGLLALAIWFAFWFRRTAPRTIASRGLTGQEKAYRVGTMLAVAALAACIRGVIFTGFPWSIDKLVTFAAVGFAAGVMFLWLELLFYSAWGGGAETATTD
jgi:hypothetical protein